MTGIRVHGAAEPASQNAIRSLGSDAMSPPLVSCLIATYNFAPYLARSIESVLEHDYPQDRIQIVVVDDGSTDDTPTVVQPYLDRITYVRKPNGGLISTVNRLLEEAQGEFITLLSGDDIWLPGRVRLGVEQLQSRPELGLTYADMRMIDAHDGVLADSFWMAHDVAPLRGRPLGQLMHQNVVAGGTLMVRASLRDHFAPIPEYAAYEDWWIALRVAQVAEIDYLTVPVYGYRKHENNQMLFADQQTVTKRLTEEIPLRRWLLTDFESEFVSAQEWLAAYHDWMGTVEEVARRQDAEVHSLVPISEENRRLATRASLVAGESLSGGDIGSAVRECVRALGHDPFGDGPNRALTAVHSALQPAAVLPGWHEVRAFVTVTDAEELIEEPGLLHAYAKTFGADDDASLLVLVDEDRIPALVAVVERAGLGGDGGPDIVALPVPPGHTPTVADSFAGRWHAVLSARDPQGVRAILPWVDDRSVRHLRGYAERRWARAYDRAA